MADQDRPAKPADSDPVLLSQLAQEPEGLYKLPPRLFERIVAELLAGLGWRVRLRRNSGDGEYDILAVSKDRTGLEASWLIDCKRYRPEYKVGLRPCKEISATADRLGFSNALIATTSHLTKEATAYLDERHNLQALTFERLVELIRKYRPPPRGTSHLERRRFHSCFVCHSSRDAGFVDMLRARLQVASIHVWHYAADAVPGRSIKEEVERAIGAFDKLLVVLSRDAMKSHWVAHELRCGRRREVRECCRLFFPISLVPIEEIRRWELFDEDTGEDLAAVIRKVVIADFSQWEDPALFEHEFARLLRGLEHSRAA